MAYSTSNPPALIAQGIGGANKVWAYSSTDAGTAADAAGYFTNGVALGMKTGDGIIVVDNDASPVEGAMAFVNAVSSTGTDITNGTAATDSD